MTVEFIVQTLIGLLILERLNRIASEAHRPVMLQKEAQRPEPEKPPPTLEKCIIDMKEREKTNV